jgi:biopolymer transport protein ExbD
MGFNRSGDDGEIGSINITPMVDIILVLLVIFMVTANFIKRETVNINIPKIAAADPDTAKSVMVSVTRDGDVLLEGKAVDESGLVSRLSGESKRRPNMRVNLSADESISYGALAKVMGVIKHSGVNRIALSVKR